MRTYDSICGDASDIMGSKFKSGMIAAYRITKIVKEECATFAQAEIVLGWAMDLLKSEPVVFQKLKEER